jgi:2-phospho-L-lactate guanylyltransferase
MRTRWLLVVPVKPLAVAKSRLQRAVPDAARPDLVLAMAADTIAAALEVADVLVVSNDRTVGEAVTALGAACIPDAPHAGLNAAIVYGAAHSDNPNVAALTADLPALRSPELAEALGQATVRSFVPDAEGTGTVLLAAPAGVALAPRFGTGSAAAHLASGARRLDGDWPTLRRDIDTGADLEAGKDLGLGARTHDALCAITSEPR